jgi:hypothetical protein
MMETKRKLKSLVLTGSVLISVLILFSSTASASGNILFYNNNGAATIGTIDSSGH